MVRKISTAEQTLPSSPSLLLHTFKNKWPHSEAQLSDQRMWCCSVCLGKYAIANLWTSSSETFGGSTTIGSASIQQAASNLRLLLWKRAHLLSETYYFSLQNFQDTSQWNCTFEHRPSSNNIVSCLLPWTTHFFHILILYLTKCFWRG